MNPYSPSEVDSPHKPSRFLRVAGPVGGAFLLTVLTGGLAANAPAEMKEAVSKYVPQQWLTGSAIPACRDGRCATGVTPIGLPESCFADADGR